jgi:hypothetical protein
MTTQPFTDWLRLHGPELVEEYTEDSDEPFDAREFRTWAKLQYDNLVLGAMIRNRQPLPPLP